MLANIVLVILGMIAGVTLTLAALNYLVRKVWY